MFVDFLKQAARLDSTAFVVTLFGIGILLLYVRPRSPWGRRWLTGALIMFWFVSTSVGAGLVAWPLVHAAPHLESRADANGATAVVMLGGGIRSWVADGLVHDDLRSSALRAIETARLYHLLGDPLVIASGGNTGRLTPPHTEAAAFRDALIELGVPPARIVIEDRSLNTHDEAVLIKPMIEQRGIDRFVLVTSPLHISRATAAFRAVGLNPVPSPTRLRSARDRVYLFIPQSSELSISDNAIYEYAAWMYYWTRGWL